MKKVVKFLLNRVPRPVVQRMAGWAVPVVGALFYAGRRVQCPVCGHRYRKMMPYGYVSPRANALCPHCLALERHRLLWLYLERESDLLRSDPPLKFLHIAPEVCLMRKFRRHYDGANRARYVTADLESPLAEVKMDVQAIPFPDETFDVIFCNHILEHVDDDRLAMREMFRVMRRGGWGIMLSPVDPALQATFEDDSITDPAERTRVFGQYDHRRNYGRDYADRLREAGFEVEENDYVRRLSPDEVARYALRSEVIYVVRKPAGA